MRLRLSTSALLVSLAVFSTACRDGSPAAPNSAAGTSSATQTLVDVPVDVTVTSGGTGTWNWAGQSFTVVAGTTLSSISFNWYSFQRTPVAFGRLHLLDREYLGLPRDLGPGTPGYIATSEGIEDGAYIFAAGTTITGGSAGRQFWVYTDTQGSFAHSFDRDTYPGGDLYATGFHGNPFRKSPASGRMVNGLFVPGPVNVFIDANFRLRASVR